MLARAEAHDPLDSRSVVPGAVEEHDLAGRRQVLDIALEVPLAALLVVGLRQGDDPRAARIEVLGQDLDGAALAGRGAALEYDDDPLAVRLDPVLQLDQLDLQAALLALAGSALQAVWIGLVGLAAGGPLGEVVLIEAVLRPRGDTGLCRVVAGRRSTAFPFCSWPGSFPEFSGGLGAEVGGRCHLK